MEASVVLKKGAGRTLSEGGCRVYDNEIQQVAGEIHDGDIASVVSCGGQFLGRGFWNSRSKIRVRVLSRHEGQKIDDRFFHERLLAAWEYRKRVLEDTSSCRIVFSDADFLSGLVVDKYEDILVMEAQSLGVDVRKDALMEDLLSILRSEGIPVRGVYERSDAKVRELEGLERKKGFFRGRFDPKVQITENGLKMVVDVESGQKTGHFLDQRENRRKIRKICAGGRVLDCFTHTGGFALNAALAGAREVTGADASETALRQAEENAARNHLEGKISLERADVFDLLPSLEERGERYDVVILDPPAFAKTASSVKGALKGYRQINREGMRLVKPGGFLVTFSCSENISRQAFRQMLEESAGREHKRLRMAEWMTQAKDHPIVWGNPYTEYLKGAVLQVLDRW